MIQDFTIINGLSEANGFIDLSSVIAARKGPNNTCIISTYGGAEHMIKSDITELKKQVQDSKQPGSIYGSPNNEVRVSDRIKVGEHSFQIDIHTSEYNGEKMSSLMLNSSFPCKNPALETIVGYVNGVEKMNEYSWEKYRGHISIGKMFDPETVKKAIEQKIIEFLSEEQ
ncbi:MAG: hypothetical protein V4721_10280 [Bacteroidota bacterium]